MTRQEALEKARTYVAETVGDAFAVDEQHLRETLEVFVFHYHTKKYLLTGNFQDMTVGQGPILIDKADGRITPFGSAFSSQAAIEDYLEVKPKLYQLLTEYADFDLTKHYDVTITEVLKKWELLDVLDGAGLQYVKPELQAETIWRIAKPYNKRQIEERIGKLPVIFMDIAAKKVVELCTAINVRRLAVLRVSEHHRVKHESNIHKATAKDLEPKW